MNIVLSRTHVDTRGTGALFEDLFVDLQIKCNVGALEYFIDVRENNFDVFLLSAHKLRMNADALEWLLAYVLNDESVNQKSRLALLSKVFDLNADQKRAHGEVIRG